MFDFNPLSATPADGQWGLRYPNGTWAGMLGQLVDGTADFAPTGFTVTSERKEAVDFLGTMEATT